MRQGHRGESVTPPTGSPPAPGKTVRCKDCAYHDTTSTTSPVHGTCCHVDSDYWGRRTHDIGTCHLASSLHEPCLDSRFEESLTLSR